MKNKPTVFSRWVVAGATCLLSLVTRVCSADLTFDEGPWSPPQIANGYGGLQWNNFYVENATNNSSGFLKGMITAPGVAYNGFGQAAAVSSSNLFTLGSAYFTAVYVSGMQMRVRGYVTNTVSYDNTYAINGSAPTLICFNYTNIDHVTFDTSSLFAMDNLSLTVSGTNTTCTLAVSPNNRQHGPFSEPGSFDVYAPGGCAWTVSNSNDWVIVTSGSSGITDGIVSYSVTTNLTGHARSGFIVISGQTFAVTQFAPGGTNQIYLGEVECPSVGHYFFSPGFPSSPKTVRDSLIDQDQSSGGGGVLPAIAANFDVNNQFSLTVSAPPGYKFLIRPPPGQAVRFGGALNWQGNTTNGPSRDGTLAVRFDGLEGAPPSFSEARASLSDFHGYVGFNDIRSAAFSNELAFRSMTLIATVPALNIGSGLQNYVPSSDSGLVVDYTTTQATDPGSFVSLVPHGPILRLPVDLLIQPNGDLTLTFTGTLQSSSNVDGPFSDVPGYPQGSYTIPKTSLSERQFFRTRY